MTKLRLTLLINYVLLLNKMCALLHPSLSYFDPNYIVNLKRENFHASFRQKRLENEAIGVA